MILWHSLEFSSTVAQIYHVVTTAEDRFLCSLLSLPLVPSLRPLGATLQPFESLLKLSRDVSCIVPLTAFKHSPSTQLAQLHSKKTWSRVSSASLQKWHWLWTFVAPLHWRWLAISRQLQRSCHRSRLALGISTAHIPTTSSSDKLLCLRVSLITPMFLASSCPFYMLAHHFLRLIMKN